MIQLVWDAAKAVRMEPPRSPEDLIVSQALAMGRTLEVRLGLEFLSRPDDDGPDLTLGPDAIRVLCCYCREAMRRQRLSLSVIEPDYGHDDCHFLLPALDADVTEARCLTALAELCACGFLSAVSPGRYTLLTELLLRVVEPRRAS